MWIQQHIHLIIRYYHENSCPRWQDHKITRSQQEDQKMDPEGRPFNDRWSLQPDARRRDSFEKCWCDMRIWETNHYKNILIMGNWFLALLSDRRTVTEFLGRKCALYEWLGGTVKNTGRLLKMLPGVSERFLEYSEAFGMRGFIPHA